MHQTPSTALILLNPEHILKLYATADDTFLS